MAVNASRLQRAPAPLCSLTRDVGRVILNLEGASGPSPLDYTAPTLDCEPNFQTGDGVAIQQPVVQSVVQFVVPLFPVHGPFYNPVCD